MELRLQDGYEVEVQLEVRVEHVYDGGGGGGGKRLGEGR